MDIVIIGAQKAGTTWLHTMLKQQPRVGFSFMKEVHYFNQVAKSNFQVGSRIRYLKNRNPPRGSFFSPGYKKYMEYVLDEREAFTDQWYKNTFLKKPENQKIASKYGSIVYSDATPAYGSMPESGVAHMARLLPGIVPVLIVRDPVRRMISGFSMSLSRRMGKKSWSLDKSLERLRSRQVPRGDYARQIPLFRRYFSELMIIPFGIIQTDPVSILRQIEQKFSLDPVLYKGLEAKRNSHTERVELASEILDEISRLCAPQYEYLAQEFGPNFLGGI